MNTALRTAVVTACLCLLLAASVHGQSGLRSFLNTPAEKFDAADWTLLKSAAVEALNDPGANASRSWNNSANDHHGVVQVLKAFASADGRQCKRLRFDSFATGLKGSASYNVCRARDGQWHLDS
jgi:surface antigen